jgi:hypothetical protein
VSISGVLIASRNENGGASVVIVMTGRRVFNDDQPGSERRAWRGEEGSVAYGNNVINSMSSMARRGAVSGAATGDNNVGGDI